MLSSCFFSSNSEIETERENKSLPGEDLRLKAKLGVGEVGVCNCDLRCKTKRRVDDRG